MNSPRCIVWPSVIIEFAFVGWFPAVWTVAFPAPALFLWLELFDGLLLQPHVHRFTCVLHSQCFGQWMTHLLAGTFMCVCIMSSGLNLSVTAFLAKHLCFWLSQALQEFTFVLLEIDTTIVIFGEVVMVAQRHCLFCLVAHITNGAMAHFCPSENQMLHTTHLVGAIVPS